MKKCGIYKIASPTGRIYIGSSKDIVGRWRYYKNLRCKEQRRLYLSLLKYGYENHAFEIVEICSITELFKRERHYGLLYNVLSKKTGLNCQIPGELENTIQFSSDYRKRRSKAFLGEKNPFFGKSHNEATKKHLSMIRKDRIPHNKGICGVYKASEQAKENMSRAQIGRKHSQDTLLKMKFSNKNLKVILNLITGIFYDGGKEAANAMNYNYNNFKSKLNGSKRNNTDFVFV